MSYQAWKGFAIDWSKLRGVHEPMEVVRAKPACVTNWRVMTQQEARSEDRCLEKYGGQTPRMCREEGDCIVCEFKTEVVIFPRQWMIAIKQHSFPDTGMRKSWCKHCDAVGHFDFESGTFLAAE